jgi:DHA2 family multidrug resistance protein-like MFS transporter
MGNAVSRTVQSVGVALGTAILGSALNAAYRGALASHQTGLPVAARGAASASIAAARGVAERLSGQAGAALARAAGSAYVHGMVRGEAVGIGVLLAGAIMCLLLLPGQGQERST